MSVSLTVVNKGPVSHDVQITNNGDGTLGLSPSRVAVLGSDGRTVAHFSGLFIIDLLIDDAGTRGDPTIDESLSVLDSTSHGNLDAPVLCELARQHAP